MKSEVAIIGGGPAGIAAAIQLKRHGLDPILFECGQLGGLVRNASSVENYPGFPNGISGIELVRLFGNQLQSSGVVVHRERVELLEYDEASDHFLLHTADSDYSAGIVIIASGTKPKKLDTVESIPKCLHERVYYEIYPIISIKNKQVVIVGAGDVGLDYALSLSPYNDVEIINRGNNCRALPLLRDRIRDITRIKYHENACLSKVERAAGNGLIVTIAGSNQKWSLEADYLVIAIGREPQKEFYSPRLLETEETLIKRGLLYLAGDVKNDSYRQVGIAVGDGIRVVMQIGMRGKSTAV